MGDLEEYTASVAASLRRRGAGRSEVAAGHLEGLRARGPARLRPKRRETEKHHSGYLTGHLLRWLHERGRTIDGDLVTTTSYAGPIAHAEARRALQRDKGLMSAHLYAVLMIERRFGAALAEEDERMVFGWLCEQAGATVTAATVARFERVRAERLERHGWT